MQAIAFLTRAAHALALRWQRTKLRWALLGMNDRTLEDIGYSRALLKRGVGAWPWRIEEKEWNTSRRAAAAAPPPS